MTSRHVVTIELVNPEYVLAIRARRAVCLNAYEDVIIRLPTIEVAKALKAAVRQKVWQLRDIADSPRNAKSLRRELSKAPTPPYRGNALRRLQTGHPQRETHTALEIDISDAAKIEPGDVGQLLSLDSSEYGLAIRNIPVGLALVSALESVIWEFDNDPYGPRSDYAQEQRQRQQEIQAFCSKLRDRLYGRTGDREFLEDYFDIIQHIRAVIADGTAGEVQEIKAILRAALVDMERPPEWAYEALQSRSDSR